MPGLSQPPILNRAFASSVGPNPSAPRPPWGISSALVYSGSGNFRDSAYFDFLTVGRLFRRWRKSLREKLRRRSEQRLENSLLERAVDHWAFMACAKVGNLSPPPVFSSFSSKLRFHVLFCALHYRHSAGGDGSFKTAAHVCSISYQTLGYFDSRFSYSHGLATTGNEFTIESSFQFLRASTDATQWLGRFGAGGFGLTGR